MCEFFLVLNLPHARTQRHTTQIDLSGKLMKPFFWLIPFQELH
jgi:hypothetical protein